MQLLEGPTSSNEGPGTYRLMSLPLPSVPLRRFRFRTRFGTLNSVRGRLRLAPSGRRQALP